MTSIYGFVLLFHLLGATIWTGGHIVLVSVVLPRVLRERSPEELMRFESVYEKIGMPALIVQVVSGVILVHARLPDPGQWLDFENPVARVAMLKFFLLALTVGFALDARFRVIPKLSQNNLTDMAWHIIPVTVFSILFVVVGVSFRTGWLY